jgi:hypothetical protein
LRPFARRHLQQNGLFWSFPSQTNINKLVTMAEHFRMTEVNAWADASRQKEQLDGEKPQTEPRKMETNNPVFEAEG